MIAPPVTRRDFDAARYFLEKAALAALAAAGATARTGSESWPQELRSIAARLEELRRQVTSVSLITQPEGVHGCTRKIHT